jgi:RNA polymerase sigma factor (TIGR02999 family)
MRSDRSRVWPCCSRSPKCSQVGSLMRVLALEGKMYVTPTVELSANSVACLGCAVSAPPAGEFCPHELAKTIGDGHLQLLRDSYWLRYRDCVTKRLGKASARHRDPNVSHWGQSQLGVHPMPDVTLIIDAIRAGDPDAPAQLLPLVYDELRRLAAHRLAQQPAGQTLQPTALVHEAYLRLFGGKTEARWDSRRHFFAAAAKAMRHILIDSARHKHSLKRGGGMVRRELDEAELLVPEPREDLLALDDALTQLAGTDPAAADLVQLRYFGGLSIPEAAETLGISTRSAERLWAYARVRLYEQIKKPAPENDLF